MSVVQKVSLFLLRVGLGWVFLWAGMTKVLKPAWSAAGYLQGAKTFPDFYHWLASPAVLPMTNVLNEWGLVLLGVALILGVGVRLAAVFGSLLMVLYWLPILQFPYAGPNAYLVDDHIIYVYALFVLATFRAGSAWSIGPWFASKALSKYPRLRAWFE